MITGEFNAVWQVFLDNSALRGKDVMSLNLCEKGQNTTLGTPRPTTCVESVDSLTSAAKHVTLKIKETGRTVYSPYPRRFKLLTINRCTCNFIR